MGNLEEGKEKTMININPNPPQARAVTKAQLLIELNLLENRAQIYNGGDTRIIRDERTTVVKMIEHLGNKLKDDYYEHSNATGKNI